MRMNVPVFLIGLIWWCLAWSFFGWNNFPQSTPELFADGLAFVFYAAAFAFPRSRPRFVLRLENDAIAQRRLDPSRHPRRPGGRA